MVIFHKISRCLFVLFYGFAGIMHFVNPDLYLRIMPTWLPAREFLNLLSGAVEIGVAILMCFPKTRRLSSWITILMLLSFLIVHAHMLVNAGQYADIAPKTVLWLRFPVQILLMWWAWSLGKSFRIGLSTKSHP